MKTLRTSLIDFVWDEGIESAVDKAEKYRDVLEEMIEAASPVERVYISCLLENVQSAICDLVIINDASV